MSASFTELVASVRACRHCEKSLTFGPRPMIQVDPDARILIAGQAPGRRVHDTGIPFDDPSGERLRDWMGISSTTFYDASLFLQFAQPSANRCSLDAHIRRTAGNSACLYDLCE